MAKLYFRYGAMNSGKSTALMQVAHNYEEQGMRVLILKPQVDTKGGGELVAHGIQGFWNFSHYDLSVEYPGVTVENVHLGDSLMSLGYRLRNQD